MKKALVVLVVLLVLGGLVYVGVVFLPQFLPKKSGPLFDVDVQKAKEAVLCDNDKHSCANLEKTADSGNLSISITANGVSLKGLEVDVGTRPGATQYYIKYTDSKGIALFNGLPSGKYTIYFNGNNFPKGYGDSPTESVEITKGKTAEIAIELHRSP